MDPATAGLWRRCLGLGPAPEFCLLAAEAPAGVAPTRLPAGWARRGQRTGGASGRRLTAPFATLGFVVATGAEVESTTGKRRACQPRAWAPSDHRHSLEVRPSEEPHMTPSPPTAETQLVIPDELQARRRPLRLRALEGPPAGARRARRRGRRADGHLPPPEAGQGARRRDPRRPARAVRACPTAMRWRSATAAPPPSGTPPRSASSSERRAAPDLRGVLAEVRHRHRRRAVPRGPGRDLRRPGRRARSAGVGPAAAEAGADVLAWAHNETSTGVMVPIVRPPAPGRRSS